MATIKVSIELDDASLQREIREAAATTKREFDKLDAGSNLQKKAKTAFDQIGKDAHTATAKMQSELEAFSKRGFFKTIADNAKTAFTAIHSGARSMFGAIGNMAQTAIGVFGGNLLTNAISKLTNVATQGIKSGIDYKSRMEGITVALTTVTGSAEAAAKQIERIQKLADQTPFSFPDLAQAAASMQGFGFGLKETELNLRGVADAASRLALINQTSFGDSLKTLVVVMGQIRGATKLTTENMIQLEEKGVPVFALLAEAMKKTRESLQEDIAGGLISGSAATEALLEMFRTSTKIVGFAENAGKTFAGRMSTLEDLIEKRTGEALTGAFNNLKQSIEKTIKLLEGEGGDKLTAALSVQFAKPVELLNRALDALQTGNIGGFIKQTAKDALTEIVDTMKEGFVAIQPHLLTFLDSVIIQPLSTALNKLINETFGGVLAQINTAIDKLNKFLAAPKVPAVPEGAKPFVPKGGDPGTSPETLDQLRKQGLIVQPIVFQRTKPQQSQREWEQTIKEYQEELKRETARIRQQTPLPILPNLAFGLSPAIRIPELAFPTVPGVAGGGQLITEQTDALKEHGKVTEQSTDIIKENAEAMTDWRNRITITSKAAQDVFDFGLRQSFEGMVSSVVSGSQSIAAAVSTAFAQIKSRLADFVGITLGKLFFGGGGGGTGGTGGAGGGGGGGFFGNLFGGGGTGGGGVANLFGAGGGGGTGGGGTGGFVNAIKNLFRGGGGTAIPGSLSGGIAGGDFAANLLTLSKGGTIAGTGTAAAGFSLSGLGAGLAGLAPVVGALGGAALGGTSIPGQILGAVGGSFAGLAIGAALAPSIFGTVFASLGILGPLGAALAIPALIGAYFLGKSKQRKSDEQAADAIWSDELNRTRELVAAVNSDRMDGGEALAAWASMRAQTVAQLNQIKTKSVRESRLKNQLGDLDRGVVTELRNAANRQARRRGLSGSFVPEFQTGGFVPGLDTGRDNVLIAARPGEVILNRSQQGALKQLAGRGILQQIGVPGFEGGGAVPAMPPPISQGPIRINLAFEGEASEILGKIIVRGANTSSGQRAIVNVIKTGRRNGDL